MSVADKLTTIAENQQKVYDAGYAKGKQEGGNTGYELITMTSSVSNAYNAMNLFASLRNADEKHIIFSLMQNDVQAFPNNQCIAFEIHYMDNTTNGEPFLWSRYRDSIAQSFRTISLDYDLIVNVGDVYKKVVLL